MGKRKADFETEGTTKKEIDPFLLDLSLEIDESIGAIPDLDDDLQREAALQKRATAAAKSAYDKITSLGIAFFRPPAIQYDMFKTAEEMHRRDRMRAEEEEAQKELERMKREREQRKFAKTMAKEAKVVKQEVASKAKKEEERLKRSRKSLLSSSHPRKEREDDDFEVDVMSDNGNGVDDDPKGKKPLMRQRKKSESEKRQGRDKRYGFGGKKRGSKANTRDSLDAGLDDFNPKHMKTPFKGLPGSGKSRRGKKTNRPGKQRRHSIKAKKASRK